LAQLDAIFSAERKRGHDSDIVTWGDLGLKGKWANAPIRLYGRNNASGTHATFKKLVLQKGSYKDSVQEKVGSAEIVRSIAGDPFGIGYSGIGYKTDNVGVCPLASEPGGKAYGPEMKHAYNGNYPLARFLYLTFNINPDSSVTPVQREFIKFVFSRKGQEIVTKEGFFPVSEGQASKALALANE
jgi:phosphate transport system substrate-binding protein